MPSRAHYKRERIYAFTHLRIYASFARDERRATSDAEMAAEAVISG